MSKTYNPFPGLRSFRTDEKYLFFGREEHTAELLRRLRETRFLAVVGTSGSGKSSLVKAGVLPELHKGTMTKAGSNWEVTVMRPGGNPMRNLAQALVEADLYDPDRPDVVEQVHATLSRSRQGLSEAARQSDLGEGANLLVVVDQFEELFRFRRSGAAQDRAEAVRFVQLLLAASAEASPAIYVVLTMRSDYLGDCTTFPGLAEAVNAAEFLIPRMTREQRRAAIEGPVKVAGAAMAPRLLQKLLNDLGDDPDQLPILQHALMRTWDVWAEAGETDALDLDDYHRVGRMDEALSLHADEVYHALASDREREWCRGIFKALTVKESENRGIRRPQRLATLGEILEVPIEELVPVIDAFRRQGVTFLMPPAEVELTGDTVIDISHESLMRVWGRLRQWVEEEAQAVGIYRRLAENATLHARGEAGLFRDPELGLTLSWLERSRHANAAWGERYQPGFDEAMAFLEQSKLAAEAEEQEREAARQRELERAKELAEAQRLRAEEQKRAAGRLKVLLAGITVIMLGMAALAVWAVKQSQRAEAATVEARTATEEAQASTEEAQFNEGLGWLLRAEVAEERQQRYPETLLYAAQAIGFEGVGRPEGAEEPLRYIRQERNPAAFERAKKWIADRPSYRPIWASALRDPPASGLSVSATGRWLALASEDGRLAVWDMASGSETEIFAAGSPAGVVADIAFHPLEDHLAIALEGTVQVWDLKTNALVEEHPAGAGALAWSPGGELLAAAVPDGSLRLLGGEVPITLASGLQTPAARLSFSPENSIIAAAYPGQGVRVFLPQARAAAELWAEAAVGGASSVAVSPDGARLAIGTADGSVSLWDATTAERLGLVPAELRHGDKVLDLAFRADGQQLASASADGTVKLWDVSGTDAIPTNVATLCGHLGAADRVAYVPGGESLTSAAADGSARLWWIGEADAQPDLFSYLEQGFFAFDPGTQATRWAGGSGFLGAPAGSLAGLWQNADGAKVADYLLAAGHWSVAGKLGADAGTVSAALLADAEKAAEDKRWLRVDLRLRQLAEVGGEEGADAVGGLTAARAAATAGEGEPFTSSDGIAMVWCPATGPEGFPMGSPPEEAGRKDDETLHDVVLSSGFWIGKYELTQGEWEAVMGSNPSNFSGAGAKFPVENVSWLEAVEFCRRLTYRERTRGTLPPGWEYALPSEAQWEYACRAGTTSPWSFGDDPADLHKHGNYNDRNGNGIWAGADKEHDDGHRYTAPVGSYAANAWGLHDMHGNVWEWCRDSLDPANTAYGSGKVSDPLGTLGRSRVSRGGSFIYAAGYCRSANRSASLPSVRYSSLGFRPAVVPSGTVRP